MTTARKCAVWLVGFVLLAVVFYLVNTRPLIQHFQGQTMGTTYHVSYVSPRFSHSLATISQSVHAALHDVDLRMSTYRDDSELMRFNRAPVGQPFPVSEDLATLVLYSQRLSQLSQGAYDVTVGPLVNLWGFGPSKYCHDTAITEQVVDASAAATTSLVPTFMQWLQVNHPSQVPTEQAITAAKQQVGYHYVTVDSTQHTLTRQQPVFVDLSSIAKGHGVDRAAQALRSAGIEHFMIEVGGEVIVAGQKPDGSPWRLAIKGPGQVGSDQSVAIVAPKDKALATSGNYLNYFEVAGQRYGHTLNPKTGRPEITCLVEASVIADTAAEADGLATVFMVLGNEQGLALANREGIAAYFTYQTDQGLASAASEAFKPYLIQQPESL